jgi:hypothetical protein
MFKGSFPESMSALTKLEYLSASRTYLGGVLPRFLLRDMLSLVKLDISHCSFEGQLPPIDDRMENLRIVKVNSHCAHVNSHCTHLNSPSTHSKSSQWLKLHWFNH